MSEGRARLRRTLGKNHLATIAGLAIAAIVAVTLAAPYLPIADPDTVDTPNRLRPPLSAGHVLGTDEFGRDLLSRLIWGGRVSLVAGVGAAGAAMLVGVGLGIVAGYYTGRVSSVIMRLTDILMAFPYILLAIAIVAGLGPGLRNAMVAIAIVGFPIYTRLVRSVVLQIRAREFVEAAHAGGVRTSTVIFRHIIPNCLGPVVVYVTLTVPNVILLESFLSFLGLGVQEPSTSWGVLISDGARTMESSPWALCFPAAMLAVTLGCFNFIGDGLRDALDPKDR
jgi:ABC-type dipeptide/oligopeptide/nickel transport system permease subunit